MRARLCRCRLADQEHSRSRRSYAHVGHRRGRICVAGAFYSLPMGHQLGLILHELGHMAFKGRHTEAQADRAAVRRFGIPIRYRSTKRWGRRLQWAP